MHVCVHVCMYTYTHTFTCTGTVAPRITVLGGFDEPPGDMGEPDMGESDMGESDIGSEKSLCAHTWQG